MSTLKKVMAVIGFLWANRRKLTTIRAEIEETIAVIRKALEDQNLTKEELQNILKECKEDLEAIEKIII